MEDHSYYSECVQCKLKLLIFQVAGAFGQLVLGEGEEWKGLQAYHKARGLNVREKVLCPRWSLLSFPHIFTIFELQVEVVEDDEDEDEDDEDLDEGESDESVVEAGAGMIWDDPALLVRRPPVVTIMVRLAPLRSIVTPAV